MKNNAWTSANIPDQSGKVVVATGSSSGIGYETARVLANKGAETIIAVRNLEKGNAAARKIKSQNAGAIINVMTLDVADLSSVRRFVEDFSGKYTTLDRLINNAGVMIPPYAKTTDGFELQFGTNHLGHFALTGLLMPSLLATSGSRVVTLSSNGHRTGRLNFADLQSARHYQKYTAYGRSKLANLMFTYELQRRLSAAGAPTIAVAAHPGTARTELTRHMSALSNAAMSPRYMRSISGSCRTRRWVRCRPCAPLLIRTRLAAPITVRTGRSR